MVLMYSFYIIVVILHHLSLEKWFLGKRVVISLQQFKKMQGNVFLKNQRPHAKIKLIWKKKKHHLIYLCHMQNECRI